MLFLVTMTEFILLCQQLVVTVNKEITIISNNVKGIQNSVKRKKLLEVFEKLWIYFSIENAPLYKR